MQHFNSIIFRIWNRSAGIPSPPLTLLVVMLPKVHLISHSRMSGSRWVITLLWLTSSLRFCLYSSTVYSCHLFWISYSSLRSIPFLHLLCPYKESAAFMFLFFQAHYLWKVSRFLPVKSKRRSRWELLMV